MQKREDNAVPPSSKPRVVLMCGIAGSGKTTYSVGLEKEGYTRLAIDEEIWTRFGRYGIDYDPADYAKLSAEAVSILRDRLICFIKEGKDVVIDSSFWQRSRREDYKNLIESLGATWRLIYLKADPSLLRERLNIRNQRFDANASFPITEEILTRYLNGFEEPQDEGEEVIIAS